VVASLLSIAGCATEAPTDESPAGSPGGKADSPTPTCEDYADSDACAAAG